MPNTDIPPPPSSRRHLVATEATFFEDLFSDLGLRIEWLGQVLDSVPDRDSTALAQLNEHNKALGELRKALERLHGHTKDRGLQALFAFDGPLAAYLSRLYAWCEEISDDFERLAVRLRQQEMALTVFSQKTVNSSFAHFDELATAIRAELARMRAGMAPTETERAFDAHLDEVLWATEWLHMSLARAPGA